MAELQNGMSSAPANSQVSAVPIPSRGLAIKAADLSRITDPRVLASMIERNQATLKKGWVELDRLSARLEALNAWEKTIIQRDLQSPQPSAPSTPPLSAST
jgi:hypothetical protein